MKTKFFELAKKSSKKSKHTQHKIGAILVSKNKVLATGYNNPLKTHPLSTHAYHTIHAELDTILRAPKDLLEGSTIYIYREDAKGNKKLAKPCIHCFNLLKQFRIKEVHYTIENGHSHYRNY